MLIERVSTLKSANLTFLESQVQVSFLGFLFEVFVLLVRILVLNLVKEVIFTSFEAVILIFVEIFLRIQVFTTNLNTFI